MTAEFAVILGSNVVVVDAALFCLTREILLEAGSFVDSILRPENEEREFGRDRERRANEEANATSAIASDLDNQKRGSSSSVQNLLCSVLDNVLFLVFVKCL